MYFTKVLTLAVLLAAVSSLGWCYSKVRIIDGRPVDSLEQFPHHVNIQPDKSERKCGGSILNDQWVLTSASCLSDYTRFELQFNKKIDSANDYFSISVNRDNVYVYPTNYDDLALIKVPFKLVPTQTIQPINISNLSTKSLENKFVVLPGFPDERHEPATVDVFEEGYQYDNLRYGMFQVKDSNTCKKTYGNGFNEYNALCVSSWGTNTDTPCESDHGSGLIMGWPAKPELIGIFSTTSASCSGSEFLFIYVAKYYPWIESMIN